MVRSTKELSGDVLYLGEMAVKSKEISSIYCPFATGSDMNTYLNAHMNPALTHLFALLCIGPLGVQVSMSNCV